MSRINMAASEYVFGQAVHLYKWAAFHIIKETEFNLFRLKTPRASWLGYEKWDPKIFTSGILEVRSKGSKAGSPLSPSEKTISGFLLTGEDDLGLILALYGLFKDGVDSSPVRLWDSTQFQQLAAGADYIEQGHLFKIFWRATLSRLAELFCQAVHDCES